MNRTKLTLGIAIVAGGLAYLFIAGFKQAGATHMTVSQLANHAQPEDLQDKRLQLGGTVVEGSIKWGKFHDRPTFLVTEGDAVIQVRYIGRGLVPDTFKDNSPVILEGHYAAAEKIFAAEMIFAKCPSKYEGQNYAGHVATNGGK